MILKDFLLMLQPKTVVTIEDETHCGYYAKKQYAGNIVNNSKCGLNNEFNKVEYDKYYGFIIEIKV